MSVFAAFIGDRLEVEGDILSVALRLRKISKREQSLSYLVFDTNSGHQIDLDLSGSKQDLTDRYEKVAQKKNQNSEADAFADDTEPHQKSPGRPKLGVVAREVTLLPRHWQWLSEQPGGASVALRKLVEDARKTTSEKDKIRLSKEAAYRFISAKCGDSPGFEEACRALFKGDSESFSKHTQTWPADVRNLAHKLAGDSLS